MLTDIVNLLGLFKAVLFPERYWWGLRSQEVEGGCGGGGMNITLHCHHQNDSALRWATMRTTLMFH